jgi:hypothetical protein
MGAVTDATTRSVTDFPRLPDDLIRNTLSDALLTDDDRTQDWKSPRQCVPRGALIAGPAFSYASCAS